MATATLTVKLDLNHDGVYEQDITQYVRRDQGLAITGVGRDTEMDAATPSSCTLILDNMAGKFSPEGPSVFSGFEPFVGIEIETAYNAVTVTQFTGYITSIDVSTRSEEHLVQVTATDAMFMLERSSARLALMENRTTGLIIQRLLDSAEAQEEQLCPNERFKDDTAGWSAWGGGAISRVTTFANPLHPPAVLFVEPGGALDGAKFDVTADTAQNDEVVPGVYVWPAGTTALSMRVVAINNGVRGDVGSAVTAQPGQWTRVSTIIAGVQSLTLADATLREIGIECATDSDFYVGAGHAVQSGSRIWRKIDDGDSAIERVAFDLGPVAGYIDEMRDNELGGLFYMKGTGEAVFEARSHRWISDHLTSQQTFTETVPVSYNQTAEQRVQMAEFSYAQWELGAAGSVVKTLEPVPVTLPDGVETVIDLPFEGALVRSPITPVANTDYAINSAPDGSGSDLSGSVTLDFEAFGGAAVARFTNSAGQIAYLTMLQVRGQPVRPPSGGNTVRATPTTVIPLARTLTHDYAHNASMAGVHSWAEYIAFRFGDTQRPTITIELKSPFPVATVATEHLADILERKISDRVTVTEDDLPWSSGINADYYIDGIDIEFGLDTVIATWRLSPIEPDASVAPRFATVDVSVVDGPDPIAP